MSRQWPRRKASVFRVEPTFSLLDVNLIIVIDYKFTFTQRDTK